MEMILTEKAKIRTMTLDSFDELTEAFLRQVKNAEDDHYDHVNQPALGALQDQQNGAVARGGMLSGPRN